jgi:hypothetical protein
MDFSRPYDAPFYVDGLFEEILSSLKCVVVCAAIVQYSIFAAEKQLWVGSSC